MANMRPGLTSAVTAKLKQLFGITTEETPHQKWVNSTLKEIELSIENAIAEIALCFEFYQKTKDHLHKIDGFNSQPPNFSPESNDIRELKFLLGVAKEAAITSRGALNKIPSIAKKLWWNDPHTQPFGLHPMTQQPYSYTMPKIRVKNREGDNIVCSNKTEIFGFLDLAEMHNKAVGGVIGLCKINTLLSKQEKEEAIQELTKSLIPEKFFTYNNEPNPPAN